MLSFDAPLLHRSGIPHLTVCSYGCDGCLLTGEQGALEWPWRAPLVLADELGALELVADLQIEIPLHGIGLANKTLVWINSKHLCGLIVNTCLYDEYETDVRLGIPYGFLWGRKV